MPVEEPVLDPVEPVEPPVVLPVVVTEVARADGYILEARTQGDVATYQVTSLSEAVDDSGASVKIKGPVQSIEAKKLEEEIVQVDVAIGQLTARRTALTDILALITR